MNKSIVVVSLVLVAVAGCKSGAAKNNPTVNTDEQAAQAAVQKCAATANFITSDGRAKFYKCLAPNGGSEAVQKCATGYLATDGVLTKTQRSKFYADVSKCLLPASPTPTKKGTKH